MKSSGMIRRTALEKAVFSSAAALAGTFKAVLPCNPHYGAARLPVQAVLPLVLFPARVQGCNQLPGASGQLGQCIRRLEQFAAYPEAIGSGRKPFGKILRADST